VFGALFGLIIAPFARFPRSWMAFVVLLLINAAVPYLTATKLLTVVNTPFVAHFALFVTGAVLILNLAFIVWVIWRAIRPGERTVGEAA
jgi:hypothetical protein